MVAQTEDRQNWVRERRRQVRPPTFSKFGLMLRTSDREFYDYCTAFSKREAIELFKRRYSFLGVMETSGAQLGDLVECL